jgi:xanthine dehydrogenase YagR molybdenum-binding subunit
MPSWPTERTLLGTSIKRLDGPAKASGRAKYTYDLKRPGMLYGRIVRSPHPHAEIVAIDVSDALKAPGVKAAIPIIDPGKKVLFAGQEVAAVAAATEEQARDAARLVRVKYNVLPHLATVEQAMRPEAPAVFPKGNFTQGNVTEEGDLAAGFKAAAHIIEATYSTQVQTHTSLETHGCICEWEGDKLTVWASTQAVHGTREGLAKALDVPQANVRVLTEYMGGGFGSKLGSDAVGVIAARLAREAKAAVHVMLDRKEEHLATGNRPSAVAKIKAGVGADGMLTAFDAETTGTGGAGQGSGFQLPYPLYLWPARRRRHVDAYTNAGPQRAFRAPGHPQGSFITEMLMDELADKARIDPLELRIKNLPKEEPNQMWRKYFLMGAEQIGWKNRHPTGDSTPGPIKRGLGCAGNRWAGNANRNTKAQVEILPDGGVVMRIGTQDIGTGTRTLVSIVTAETFGLPLEGVRTEIGDSNFPFAPGSGGSVTVGSVTAAVRVTAEKALAELAAKVAPALGIEPGAIVATKGRLHSKDDPTKGMTWKEACKLLGTTPMTVDAGWAEGYTGTGTSGVQFAEVEVDVETGVTKVKRIVCIQDAGLVVDKLTAESQCIGGIIMGIGFAMFENRILDRNAGLMVNPNMEWYLLPGPTDIPDIKVTLIDQPERGVIGLGEPPTISTAAAIANAVANAAGVRVRSLPLTPDKVLEALEREKAGGTA